MFAAILPIAGDSVVVGPALHIPDGFLSPVVALAMWALTIVFVGLAVQRVGRDLGERQIPLMGIMAAFIFAAQMINFPVAGGTSGHFLGGALAAILLGPWAGIVVMTVVVGLQGLLFQDGGLLAMGANIFNMGILTAVVGFGLYRAAAGRGRWLRLGVAGAAAWLSVVAAALATALQLWLSGTSDLAIVLPAMLGVHLVIGLGEALITVAALAFIELVRPDLVSASDTREQGGLRWVVGGLLVALAVVLLSPWASADPDGLERVAEDVGFLAAAQASPFELLPDYTVPALGGTPMSTIVAGLVGALVVAGLVIGIARLLRRRAVTA
jgi:cobalt/nickel transport system permease protein